MYEIFFVTQVVSFINNTVNKRKIYVITTIYTTHNKLDYRYRHNNVVSLDDWVYFVFHTLFISSFDGCLCGITTYSWE
jgi:hypothetical protein